MLLQHLTRSVCRAPCPAGVWVIAHECGHQAFSPSQLVNDTVGFILHTLLLVPYFSWWVQQDAHVICRVGG